MENVFEALWNKLTENLKTDKTVLVNPNKRGSVLKKEFVINYRNVQVVKTTFPPISGRSEIIYTIPTQYGIFIDSEKLTWLSVDEIKRVFDLLLSVHSSNLIDKI